MAPVNYTVLGAGGFIGAALADHLSASGHRVFAPARSNPDQLLRDLCATELGHVIYCIGLTADFRIRPHETVDAHVSLLNRILKTCDIQTLVYLSSTRIYHGAKQTVESSSLCVQPLVLEDLYNLSKLLGESLCINNGTKCKIARLSNVYGAGCGDDSFVGSIISEATKNGRVVFNSLPNSEKDYVSLKDVVRWLSAIGPYGSKSIYNLASGRNTTNRELAQVLEKNGVGTEFLPGAKLVSFPEICAHAISSEFGSATATIEHQLPVLLELARNSHTNSNQSLQG